MTQNNGCPFYNQLCLNSFTGRISVLGNEDCNKRSSEKERWPMKTSQEKLKAEFLAKADNLFDELMAWDEQTHEPNLTQIEDIVLQLRHSWVSRWPRYAFVLKDVTDDPFFTGGSLIALTDEEFRQEPSQRIRDYENV
jgi:hypothetical protein